MLVVTSTRILLDGLLNLVCEPNPTECMYTFMQKRDIGMHIQQAEDHIDIIANLKPYRL